MSFHPNFLLLGLTGKLTQQFRHESTRFVGRFPRQSQGSSRDAVLVVVLVLVLVFVLLVVLLVVAVSATIVVASAVVQVKEAVCLTTCHQ